MIANLPPGFEDLEIHIQDILAKLLELQEKLDEIEKRLEDGGL